MESKLKCPITLELFEDPISTPCCGQTFSRKALIGQFALRTECPLCRSNLSNFNPVTVPRNVMIADLVNDVKNGPKIATISKEIWSGSRKLIVDRSGKYTGESFVELFLENSRFAVQPTLFIAVCDRSGSMSGAPWAQVEGALLHMIALANTSKLVDIAVVMYDSGAEIINVQNVTKANIRSLFTGGGTNFDAAYDKMFEVLRGSGGGRYSSAVVAFMTDGQVGQNERLIAKLKNMVETCSFGSPIVIHTVGFGQGCDKPLLEGMRLSGTSEGMFRYAEPGDDPDTLSMKISGIFDQVLRASTASISVNGKDVRITIDEFHKGTWSDWTKESLDSLHVVTTEHDIEVKLDVFEGDDTLFQKWISHCVDDIASKILELKSDDSVVISLLRQQIRKMISMSSEHANTLEFLESQLKNLQNKQIINIGKLSDLRFSSKFIEKAHSGSKGRDLEIRPTGYVVQQPMIADVAHNEQQVKKYNRNNVDKGRNLLQELIMSNPTSRTTPEIADLCSDKKMASFEDLAGNNSLHLATYCGQDITVALLCTAHKELINVENRDGETPITLAIKKRGFHRTIGILMSHGAYVPEKRLKSLHRYAIDNKFPLTAELLDNIISSGGTEPETIDVNMATTMTEPYIKFLYEKAKDKKPFFEVALSKGMFDLAKKIMDLFDIMPTLEHLMNWCYPKKPDAEDTPKYIDAAEMILDKNPTLVNDFNELKENPLFKAVEKGSLPHVKLMITRGRKQPCFNIDARSELGNTPLWLACAKRYPCIVEELLDQGANPNAVNEKGNPPIYTTCQVGPRKIGELLIQRGADVELVNSNGDTLILISCRNGQIQLLDLLLNYVTMEFVNRKAHIDGFNAIFASTEANRPECIRRLYEFGVDINQRTEPTNAILPNATPLHLAAYYNRLEAAKELIALGADINSQCNHMTPLLIATIQGNIEIAKLLIVSGANKEGVLAFARNPELKELLQDTLDTSNLDILEKNFHPYWNSLNIRDENGYSLTTIAVFQGDVHRVKLFKQLGANLADFDKYGLTAADYATWMRNKRMIEIVGDGNQVIINRLKKANVGIASRILFIEPIPEDGIVVDNNLYFEQRMEIVEGKYSPTENTSSIVQLNLDKIPLFNKTKRTVVGRVGSGEQFSPVDMFITEIYKISNILHENPLFETYFIDSIKNYMPYSQEIFVKTNRRWPVGTVVDIAHTFSGSTLWKLAANDFDSKKGTIIILKSNKCRSIGGAHCEVVVPPGQYRVTNWYHYDPICLGQSNIREHTFKIKEDDVLKAVVIEMTDA